MDFYSLKIWTCFRWRKGRKMDGWSGNEWIYYGGIGITVLSLLLFWLRWLWFRGKEKKLNRILDEEYGSWGE